MHLKKVVGTASISVIVLGSTVAPNVAAFSGRGYASLASNEVQIQHSIVEIIKNKDFQAWRKLIDSGTNFVEKVNLLAKINTADKFLKFAESVSLLKQGKYAQARQVRDELGLIGGLRYQYRKLKITN